MKKKQPEYMTAAEVAELLRVNIRTIYRLAEVGKIPWARQFPDGTPLPHIRGGRRRRQFLFVRKEMDAWLTKFEVKP